MFEIEIVRERNGQDNQVLYFLFMIINDTILPHQPFI